MPPNNGAAMFATPCATSSMLERCRPPIMPSATTAESSDSIPPSIAIVNAGPMSPFSIGRVTCGRLGRGNAALMAPKRLPMVSTGMCNSCTSAVVTISATNEPGMRRSSFGQTRMMTKVSTASPSAAGLSESKCRANASHLAGNSAGTAPISSPSRSFT